MVQPAHQSRNQETTRLLAKVVDPATGTVWLRRRR